MNLNQIQILGILNLSPDSFSDGGLYSDPAAAIAGARALSAAGADIIDVGAVSSNPDAASVSIEEERRRLFAILPALQSAGLGLSVDSPRSVIQRECLAFGVEFLNDISGFSDPDFYGELAAAAAKLVVMHKVQSGDRADRRASSAVDIVDAIRRFFEQRLQALIQAGIPRERLIIDPGMGFFLGADPQNSVRTLQSLATLKAEFGLPLLISVSRKSFLGALTGRDVKERGAATLAAELFAARAGVDYIRSHDPGALRDALRVEAALC